MRIIAGKYRRRKLQTNPGLTTRPITDRAKEPLFERLDQHLSGARVADIFAGTGTLGLEALSRGARSAVFIEQDVRAVELLRRNIEMLGVQDETLIWRTDAFRSSYRPKGVPEFLPFDLLFFDPPYRMIAGLQPKSPLFKSLERLSRPAVSSENAILCLRTPARADFVLPEVWAPRRTLDLSSMEVHLFEKSGAGEPADPEPAPPEE
jgi:16S rRNA (guanine966-N2)-methyltransferase